jgi:hypothetical protein
MSTKKFKAIDAVHPVGVAVFPKLDQPYYYDKNQKKSFPDPNAEHDKSDMSISIAYEEADAQPLIQQIKDYAVDQGFDLEEVKNWPFRKEKDKETGKPTGRWLIKWKQYAKTMSGELNHVPHFDAKLNKLPKGFRITGGSIVRPKGRILAFDVGAQNGIRLLLAAIQVVEKKEFQADASGFDEVEDGFTADTNEEAAPADKGIETYEQPAAEAPSNDEDF